MAESEKRPHSPEEGEIIENAVAKKKKNLAPRGGKLWTKKHPGQARARAAKKAQREVLREAPRAAASGIEGGGGASANSGENEQRGLQDAISGILGQMTEMNGKMAEMKEKIGGVKDEIARVAAEDESGRAETSTQLAELREMAEHIRGALAQAK